MVREARFSRDAFDERDLPGSRNDLDSLDDPLLDPLPPDLDIEPPETRRKAERDRQKNSPPRRHLAGADWLNAPSEKAARNNSRKSHPE